MTTPTTTSSSAAADTRVCIKNLPPSVVDEAQLQALLIQGSTMPLIITDVKILKRQSDGKSRKLAFVGFQTSKEASYVVQHFDKTYWKTSRIRVEYALTKEAAPKVHRPWSKHSIGSSKYEQLHGTTAEALTTKTASTKAVDKRKEEFLAAMGVTSEKTKFWANDLEPPVVVKPTAEAASSSSSDSSDDEASSVATDDSADVSTQPKAVAGAVLTDLDFLKSKTTDKQELESDGDESSSSSSSSSDSSDDSDSDDGDTKQQVDTSSKSASDPSDSEPAVTTTTSQSNNETTTKEPMAPKRLFVRNIPFAASVEEVQQHFESFGSVVECHIPMDDQGRNKGFCFVAYQSTDSAARAKDALDGLDFQGRILHIMPARKGQAGEPQDLSKLSFKERQEVLRRQEASNTQSWSSSFVRGDAVVDNLASRLGLKKGDILDVKDGLSSGNAAVRLALGETQIIKENRDFFRNQGIDLDVLVSLGATTTKRSSSSILVKNLPFETVKDDLTKLFGADALKRILLAPSKTIALVEYKHGNDAKKAFKKLAYKRFMSVPLYLEWAPLACKLLETATDDTDKQVDETSAPVDADDGMQDSVSFSIYIKNLNFKTTEESLRSLFCKHVPVRAVKIPVKVAAIKNRVRPNDVDQTALHSMGFGFVECDSEASVAKAIKAVQGFLLDGHKLELKRSSKAIATQKSPSARNKSSLNAKPTKIMCRNVPFQATRKELLQLFGSFGHLKKVRLPKKFDGGHRGFAFIEYASHKESFKAMTALSRTHLYGRHLVLEWASDKDDMDTLRGKAKRDVRSSSDATESSAVQPRLNKKIRF